MKIVSYVLSAVGLFLFLYAIVGRFVYNPTVFGYIRAFETRTVVIGANTLLLLAVLAILYSKGSTGPDQKSEG